MTSRNLESLIENPHYHRKFQEKSNLHLGHLLRPLESSHEISLPAPQEISIELSSRENEEISSEKAKELSVKIPRHFENEQALLFFLQARIFQEISDFRTSTPKANQSGKSWQSWQSPGSLSYKVLAQLRGY